MMMMWKRLLPTVLLLPFILLPLSYLLFLQPLLSGRLSDRGDGAVAGWKVAAPHSRTDGGSDGVV